jgi:hypothetical protein
VPVGSRSLSGFGIGERTWACKGGINEGIKSEYEVSLLNPWLMSLGMMVTPLFIFTFLLSLYVY